jgi:hypothetical protein
MFLTREQLLAALTELDDKRRTLYCEAKLRDAEGSVSWTSKGKTRVHKHPYGVHGRSFLQVDHDTLEIRCGACAGELNATVVKK